MMQGLCFIIFFNENYLFNDLTVCLYIGILFCLALFLLNTTKPFVLLIILELIYLFLNVQYALSWIFINTPYATVNILLILSISAAESVVGASIILKLYHTKNLPTMVNFISK